MTAAASVDTSGLGYSVRALETPLGVCVAWFSDDALCRLDLPGKTPRANVRGLGTRDCDTPARISLAAAFEVELREYFDGARRNFETPLDWSEVHGFRAKVLAALRLVPFGTVVSYGRLAELAGSPNAARAVGSAMKNNPLPIVVPCHRVVGAHGALGGYTPSLDIKRELLRLEGIRVT